MNQHDSTERQRSHHGRVNEYLQAVNDFLKEEGLATKDELDEFIFNKFSPEFTPEDTGPVYNKKGKKIHEEKWRNDVDWVKASLTRMERTITIGDLVILLPAERGRINGMGSICTLNDTEKLLEQVVRKLL